MFVKCQLPETIYLSAPNQDELVFGVGVPLTIRGTVFNVAMWADVFLFEEDEREGATYQLGRARINITISDRAGCATLDEVVKAQKDADLAALVIEG